MTPATSRIAPPRWIALPAAVALLVAVVPVIALAVRVPWARVPELVASEEGSAALGLSLRTSLLSAVIVMVVGIPLAIVMARAKRLSGALRVAVVLPMTMPPVVGGLALLAAFGRTGVIGSRWPWLAEQLSFSTPAVVLAQVFVALPFLVLALEGALRGLDPRHAEAAAGLGASRGRILFHVTLPMVVPAIISGTTLSLARALGEFGATLTFAGSLPGVTRTLPLAIYLERDNDPELALALSAVLLGIAIVLVAVGAAVPWWLARRRGARSENSEAADHPTAPGGGETVDDGAVVTHRDQPTTSDVSVRVPGLLDATLTIPGGRTTAVIGPNGAGKSTLLRALAGLPVRDGAPATVTGDAPRAVLLTQDPALLPHRTVAGNVNFAARDDARTRAELAAIGATHLADRYPASLSGGQAARVALARALAADTDAILLDEPFAALDAASAASLRGVMRRRLRGRTTLLVTHDPVDVAMLADHVVVVEDGRVAAEGAAADLLAAPATPFLASFAGLIAVRGTARVLDDATVAVVAPDRTEITGLAAAGADSGPGAGPVADGDPAVALFSPRAVTLAGFDSGAADSSARNVLACTVRAIHHQGAAVRVELAVGDSAAGGEPTAIVADISAVSLAALGLTEGAAVRASIKAMQVQVLPVAG
ncbi:molybdate ABC transporter permease subunit [uncultured Corynebacterium sp.]|uniref:molybdate ABC transporter permease subunit n=1 Tax=uncultured Corynebacterium sp. TaxID=159447 RepID=UPI0025DEDFF2|nr:molybdate ABC transporter permease subunit [uncultured Corynebacterium sp.]